MLRYLANLRYWPLALLLLWPLTLRAQSNPVYLDKYTITKVYFEGAEQLNRYYIFAHLQFKEGETYTPLELQQRLEDTRRALRTQWYFQADFSPHYYADGRVEIYVLLEPSLQRFGFMGSTPDEHSFYLGFLGERRAPGSSFRWHLGKSSGMSWYFPYIYNTLLGLQFFAEVQTQKFLDDLNIRQILDTVLWLRGGAEQFLQPAVGVKLGLAEEYWGTWDLSRNRLASEVVLAAIADLNGLYLLKSRLWAMHFYFRADVGILDGLLLLRTKYTLALLPFRWWELNMNLSVAAKVLGVLDIAALDAEVPGIDVRNSTHDFNALIRLRNILLLSQNDYDSKRTQFNAGFALEAKLGLFAGIFDRNNLQSVGIGVEIQGGLVLDVLTPGSFTTRFYFLTGMDVLRGLPVAEFMVEARY